MKISFLKSLAFIATMASGLGFLTSSVMAGDLKVALAAEPTSMDCLLYTSDAADEP